MGMSKLWPATLHEPFSKLVIGHLGGFPDRLGYS